MLHVSDGTVSPEARHIAPQAAGRQGRARRAVPLQIRQEWLCYPDFSARILALFRRFAGIPGALLNGKQYTTNYVFVKEILTAGMGQFFLTHMVSR